MDVRSWEASEVFGVDANETIFGVLPRKNSQVRWGSSVVLSRNVCCEVIPDNAGDWDCSVLVPPDYGEGCIEQERQILRVQLHSLP